MAQDVGINNRYFSAEDTIAIYTATSTSSCLVNGYYKISDSADIEDPTDPPEREFDSNTFIDVSEGDWYYDAIGFVYRNYIFNGIEENEFGVDIDISRADFVTVLYRMAGEPAVSGSSKFEDVRIPAYITTKLYFGAVRTVLFMEHLTQSLIRRHR